MHSANENSAKGAMRTSVTVVATAAMLMAGMPAFAFADEDTGAASDAGSFGKTQVVYAKADSAGSIEGVYVVNQFKAAGSETVEASDEAAYSSVKNLTDSQAVEATGDNTFTVKEGTPFLYQGNLSSDTELPWTVFITYKLDGNVVEANQLADATGQLEMTLDIEPNDACDGDYADNYLLQVSGSLDNEQATDVQAPDSITAQDSGNTKISYMVFPGKSATYTITANISDFEFSGWTLAGVPLSIALDIDDSEFADATSSMDELESAISTINDGAKSVSDGASSLGDGASNLAKSIVLVSENVSKLGGVLQDLNGAGSLLVQGSSAYSAGLTDKAASLSTQASGVDVTSTQAAYQQALQTYVGAFSMAFAKAYAQTDSAEQAQTTAMQATAAQYAAVEQATTAMVTAQAQKTGYESAASALNEAASGYADVNDGIVEFTGGVSELASASGTLASVVAQICDGAQALNSGAGTLASGSSQLASGTQELANSTTGLSNELVDQVRDKLNDYLNPSFELRDFVNGSSENLDNVQFVITTESIESSDDDSSDNGAGAAGGSATTDGASTSDGSGDSTAASDEGFFEKFLALFGL